MTDEMMALRRARGMTLESRAPIGNDTLAGLPAPAD